MTSDSQLAERLRLGDEEAFTALYEKYSSMLYNHLFYMVGKQELAEDLLHEVLMTMLTKINFYTENESLKNSFKAWLFRIATNRAIDEIRKNKVIQFEEVSVDLVDEVEVEFSLEKLWRDKKLHDLFSKLPLIQRTFLNLKVNNDLSHLEIARVCSCQVNTVKQGLFQARKTLKNLLVAEGVEL